MGKTEYDYNLEKRRVFFLIDSKSFYASVESVERGLNPLKSILVVMSEQENTNGGLVLAASPMAKKKLGVSNVMRQRDVPQDKKPNHCATSNEPVYQRKPENKQHLS